MKIKFITTNLQDTAEGTAVFYKVTNEKAFSVFKERLTKSKASVVYVKSIIQENIDDRIVYLNESEFEAKKQQLINDVYPNWHKVKVIGVTGTNGKSSIVHFLQSILNENGHKALSIGTIGVFSNEKSLIDDIGTTTPSEIDLKRILHTYSDYEYACVEVSSHALDQNRLGDIKLLVSGFTNLTQDHLDYHGTIENYLKAKIKIAHKSEKLIIPPREEELAKLLLEQKINFEIAPELEVSGLNECFQMDYNKKNISLAKAMAEYALKKTIKVSPKLNAPKGRFSTFKDKENIYVVDYAHTPDALYNLVKGSRKSFPDFYIITLFGCGGDRDKTKRPKMLAAALKYSDQVVVTTDNPRSEEPRAIIADIIKDEDKNKKVVVIEDRKEALASVVKSYTVKTLVLIAGKGHEEYQEIKGVKHFFSDIEEVKALIQKQSEAK